ncbi:MAG: hypothetical protein MJY99_00310 [Fibrobacter sp.]|nr:hypothetical protein [Fibrobacter sp.]
MRFLACFVFAVAIIALAFHYAKPLPGTNFDESFLPKPSTVKYLAVGNNSSAAGLFWIKGLTELGESYLQSREYAYLGHVANLSTSLDSMYYTPYYFVGGVTPIDAEDTSDYVVLRRGVKVFPDDWKLALGFALRLSNGPHPNNVEAANVMRPFFDSPDSTIPDHVRTMYRTFELDTMQTEMALEMAMNDVMQPRFKKFRRSFYSKIYRILGYRISMDKKQDVDVVYEEIKKIVDLMADGKLHPQRAYAILLSMKKAEAEEPRQTSANAADSAAADSTESLGASL